MKIAYSDYRQAEFRNIDDALNWAYAEEIRVIQKLSSPQMGSNGTNPEDLTPWDRAAYSAMIIKQVDELPLFDRYAITASKSKNYDVKKGYCEFLGHKISKELDRDKKFCIDICRKWAGLKMYTSIRKWADKYGVTEQCVYEWGMKKKGEHETINNSIADKLDEFYKMGFQRLEVIFDEKKIT